MEAKIKVAELFAGVGGIRLGLTKASDRFDVVWSNQWEPATKSQVASDIYVRRFGPDGHVNRDIATVDVSEIPHIDMLVGGFPCQDYSVARSSPGRESAGIQGKKGVLWWQIHRILENINKRPSILLLENVDRLLKSPSAQRGRDFAIMLASLSDLGYIVEWRLINAADYGMPQRRKRVFFIGYHKDAAIYETIKNTKADIWLSQSGTMAEAFPVKPTENADMQNFRINGELSEISECFGSDKKSDSPFLNSGIIIGRNVYTMNLSPYYDGPCTTLGDVLVDTVPKEFYISPEDLPKWEYLKGAKHENRTDKKTGYEYVYSEGAMRFPDPLDSPSRTIITAEGGPSPSRFKHIIIDREGRYRRLVPVELERLNMFPDGHTAGTSDTKRAFLMGNALVVGIVEKIAKALVVRI